MEHGNRPSKIESDGRVPAAASQPDTVCPPRFRSPWQRQQVDWETVGGHLVCVICLHPASARSPPYMDYLAVARRQDQICYGFRRNVKSNNVFWGGICSWCVQLLCWELHQTAQTQRSNKCPFPFVTGTAAPNKPILHRLSNSGGRVTHYGHNRHRQLSPPVQPQSQYSLSSKTISQLVTKVKAWS